MRRKIVVAAMFAATAGLSFPAQAAFCFEPKAPSLLFLSKPRKPYCATTRTCSDWEVESYKSEVRRYYSALEEYAAAVDRHYKQAAEYVDCMSKLD